MIILHVYNLNCREKLQIDNADQREKSTKKENNDNKYKSAW